MTKLKFVVLAVLLSLLASVGGLLTSNVTLEKHTADLVKVTPAENTSLIETRERIKRFVLLEPILTGDMKKEDEDYYLQPISSKGNTWYDMMSYMVKHSYPDHHGLITVVVPPCDSMNTCFNPVARPLRKDEINGVLCEYVEQMGKQYIRKSFENACGFNNKYGPLIMLHKLTDLRIRPEPVGQVRVFEKPPYCFCFQDGSPPYAGEGQKINTVFMGVADCVEYGGHYPGVHTFQENGTTVIITSGPSLGYYASSAMVNLVFMCGGSNYYYYLPRYWAGCCYYAHLTVPVHLIQETNQWENNSSTETGGLNDTHVRKSRSLPIDFVATTSFGREIPWYEKMVHFFYPQIRVTALALQLDNLSYTMYGFANETVKGFSFVKDTLKSHRLTLLKHQQALDFLLAKTGGLCATFNLTGGSCMTLIPDSTDNLTDVISVLNNFRSTFQPKSSSADPFHSWLTNIFGSWGAGILQLFLPVIATILLFFLIVMCFLSCAKAMVHKFITTSLTAVAIQYDNKCEDIDDENYFQQLKFYLDPDTQSIGTDDIYA